MEHSKGVGFDIKALSGLVRSLISTRILDLIDFLSVIACFWTIFWLIYFTFMKDFIEILVHAIYIYINRFRWLYRILQIDNFFNCIDDSRETSVRSSSQETDNFLPEKVFENYSGINVSVNKGTAEKVLTYSHGTPCSVKNKLMINPRVIDFTGVPSSAGINLKRTNLSPEANINDNVLSPENNIVLIPENDIVLNSENIVLSPAQQTTVLDTQQNIVLNPNLNVVFSPDDNCELDDVFTSPEQKLGMKRTFFDWSLNKIRNSFRSSSKNLSPACCVKTKCENLASKVTQVQPTGLEDKEQLIEWNDSPVNVGCCNSFFALFRSKFQFKEIVPCSMHYKRF